MPPRSAIWKPRRRPATAPPPSSPAPASAPDSSDAARTAGRSRPRSALLRLGDQTVVLVQTGRTENGLLRFQQRRVQVEADDSDPVVVVSGLSGGEQVVSSGSLLLSGML